MRKTKTTAAKILLDAGWTWEEIKAALDGDEPLAEPVGPEGPRPIPDYVYIYPQLAPPLMSSYKIVQIYESSDTAAVRSTPITWPSS